MRSHRFEDLFGLLFDPGVPALFLIGLALSAVLGNASYQLLVNVLGNGNLAQVAIIALSIAALVLVVIGLRALTHWRQRGAQVTIASDAEAEPHRGLIVLVSAGSEKKQAAPDAIRHHLQAGELSFLWLVASPEAYEAAVNLKKEIGAQGVQVEIAEVTDAHSAQETFLITRQIMQGVSSLKVDPPMTVADLIVDITGGLRPQEAGALLAADEFHCALQYMKVSRDERGGVIRESVPRAMKVEILRR